MVLDEGPAHQPAMRISGAPTERALMLVPILVAVGVILLVAGVDWPKTLYGVDQAIRGAVVAAIDAIRSIF